VCTVSGTTVTIVSGGTCTLRASQAGDANWDAASDVTRTITINRATQAVTFNALPDRDLSTGTFSVSATADSGLAVSFAASPAGVCTVSGSTVSLVTGGTCTVTASQAGDASYEPAADVSRSFLVASVQVNPATLTGGTFNASYSTTLSGSGGTAPYSFAVTAGTLPTGLSLSGNTISGTPTAAGTFNFTVTATDASPANGPFSGSRAYEVIISQAAQSITFNALPDRTLPQSPFTVSASASSGLAVVFSSTTTSVCTVAGDSVTLVTPGTCTIRAAQAGDGVGAIASERRRAR
jgi:hypothetical protein